MTDEESNRIEVSNPLASYFVEGEPDDPDSYLAHVDFYGETGERVRLLYGDSEDLFILQEMIGRAGKDLEYAEDYGIIALADKVGRADDDEELTIPDDFLDE